MSEVLPYRLTKRAGKVLLKIRKADKKLYGKINDAIIRICENPNIGEMKKGDLKGFYSLDVFHQSSNYEVCYAIEEDDNGDLIVVILIGPREDSYAELKRYLGI